MVGFRHGSKEIGDRGAVDVVPAAFALGFQDVARGGGWVCGQLEALGARGKVVLWGEG